MTTIAYEELLRKGGGNIEYVFHVCGYPWAVCTSQALVDILNADSNGDGEVDAAITAARREIFGTAFDASNDYPADFPALTPIFATLQDLGTQNWQVHEIKGELAGGDFDIEIADDALGFTWDRCGLDSGNIHGLPGVHAIAQPKRDTSVGWGYLQEGYKFEKGDTTMYVVEASANDTLDDGINNEGAWRLLWIGQECILCTTSVEGTSTQLTITGIRRGLFRSRDQHHYHDTPEEVQPIVSDVPFSIIDKPCHVFACVLNDDRTDLLYESTSDEAVVEARWGKVSNRIETSKGITKIKVFGPPKILDNDIKIPTFLRKRLSRHVFSRDESGTDNDDVREKLQCPHLVIKEYDHGTSQYVNRNIWLCAQNSTVEFNTIQDVMIALWEELGCVCAPAPANQDQVSGDGGADNGYVTTNYNYFEYNGGIAQEKKAGDPDDMYWSTFSGPLAWLYYLSTWGVNHVDKLESPIDGIMSNKPWFFFAEYVVIQEEILFGGLENPWLLPSNYGPETPDANPLFPGIIIGGDPLATNNNCAEWLNSTFASGDDRRTKYFYQFSWDYSETIDWGWGSELVDELAAKRRSANIAGGTLFLNEDYTDVFAANDVIQVGKRKDYHHPPRDVLAEISTVTYTSGYTELALQVVEGGHLQCPTNDIEDSPLFYGTGLFGIEYFENLYYDFQPPEGYEQLEPWPVGFKYCVESSTLSDIFRGLLGDTSGSCIAVPPQQQLTHILGFNDDDDTYQAWTSMIDWDDLDDKAQKAKDILGITYRIDMTEPINIYRMLLNELLLHSLTPTLEWSQTNKKFMIRFREIGPINIAQAQGQGRTLTEAKIKQLSVPKETHNDTWLANKLEVKTNLEDGTYLGNFNIDNKSAHVVSRNEANAIQITSQLSQIENIENLDDDQLASIASYFKYLLLYFGTPQPEQSCKTGINIIVDLGLGCDCLVTDTSARVPYTHALGLSDTPALVTKLGIDLGRDNCECSIAYRLSDNFVYGWAPAVYVAANQSSIGGTTITCTSSAHTFSASTGRVDCMWFDCYTWNPSDNTYTAKDCSCGDHAVIAFERGVWNPTLIGGGGDLTVTSVTSTGTIVLEDNDGSHVGNWDTTKPHIIIPDTWDNVEECQKYFVCGCDDNNSLGAANDSPHRWG